LYRASEIKQTAMIDKTYQPGEVEGRIYQTWERAGAFRAGRPERARAEPYCIVIPPPNVTGSLHMGHALNNTLQDILCRFERMRGRDVLWQPGTDHAGIATQMVVERQLMERQQPSRRAMGREAFLKRVWEWKAESGGTIVNQLKRLGASCDWSRERFTMDAGLSRTVLKVFVELYREGLIYKDKRLVNWDPKLHTAISDLEVVQVETKGHLWHIRYPIEGRCFNPDDSASFITVATTRPETMLGDTAVAVHPEDERYKTLVGENVFLPLVGRRIPIIADEYSDPEKGSGAVKITPAHDFNDFEVGKRHNLPQVNIFSVEAKLDLKDNASFLAGVPKSAELDETLAMHGLDRFAARKQIVARLEEKGLIAKIEPNTHVVPHGDRSNVVIEPFLTDQWYVNAKKLAEPAIAAVRDGKTNFVPKNWEKTYFDWMENIQPWCISRQLWWGHQIPAWYGPGENESDGLSMTVTNRPEVKRAENYFVGETEEDAIRQAERFYGRSVQIVEKKKYLVEAFDALFADKTKPIPLYRDEDVLDTWFSSALWPFSTLGWPDQTPELKRYYPTSVLVTGFDIIFFWVARMMMMGLQFMKEVPFHDVYIHRLVRDAAGAKMSKSKGNVVDPLGVIDQYGADALRFTLARGAAQGHDIRLGPQDVENNRNFATKLWNAARFVEFNGAARLKGFDPRTVKEPLNRWMARRVAVAVNKVTAAIEGYRFNEAAESVYHFIWNNYCDEFVEASKSLLAGPDGSEKNETRAMAAWAIDQILKLLHPFMPFVTEELWRVTASLGEDRSALLALSVWPQVLEIEDVPEMEAVFEVVGELRTIRTTYNVPFRETLSANLTNFGSVNTSVLSSSASSISRMANTAVFVNGSALAVPSWQTGTIQVTTTPSAGTAPLSTSSNFADLSAMPIIHSPVSDGILSIVLPTSFDLAAERARLAKEMQKADADIARVDAKLGNANFVARAPEEVVEEEKEKRAEALARKTKIAEALERLKGAA